MGAVPNSSTSSDTSSDSSGGGGGAGGCVFNPQAGFGWGWLLLLPVALLRVISRRQSHDCSR